MQFPSSYCDLSTPQVMGIVNVTPDSFSDGGKYTQLTRALEHARALIAQGAKFIDVGGESTRPGAAEVSEADELARVIPFVEALRKESDVLISVDTSKAAVMKAAIDAGADLINDVRALQEPGALDVVAHANIPVCLMHMQGQPRTMQHEPEYVDVVRDVIHFLEQRIKVCADAGIKEDNIILDPGFGFGKSLDHNYQLLNGLPSVMAMGYPLLVGMSRKSMIGQLLNRPVDQRLAGSLTLATIAAQMGAHIIRVHDVQETVDAVSIVNKCRSLE